MMRSALVLLSCALVFSGETICLGESPPAAAQAQPPKQSFWKRLFQRSGGKEEAVEEEAGMGEGDMVAPHFYQHARNTAHPESRPSDQPRVDVTSGFNQKPDNLNGKLFSRINLNPKNWLSGLGTLFTFREPKNQDDVASVHLAFLGIRPWGEIKSELETKFTLDGATALTKVLPVVGAASSSLLDVDNAAVRLSGPAAPNAPSLNNAPATPTSLIPADPSAALATGISGVTPRSATLGQETIMQYRAAQALMQNVALLNNTIKNAPLNKKYEPYVVSLQVTLMPYSRDQPYDVYTDITFLDALSDGHTHSGNEKKLVPRVVPLLVTDDLESVSSSRASRKIMQLNAALAAAVPQISGSGSYQKYKDAMEKFMGEETNALVTVARMQDNIFRVRFGASVQATKKKYAVIPQAHTIHLLLLYPKTAGKDTEEQFYTCNAVAITELREASTGNLLRKPRLGEIQTAFSDAVKPLVDAQIFKPELYRADNLLELTNYVRLNDYVSFQNLAVDLLTRNMNWLMSTDLSNQALSYPVAPTPAYPAGYSILLSKERDYEKKSRDLVMMLWSSLSQIFGRSFYSTDTVDLPVAKHPKLAQHPGSVLATDDGTKLTLRYTGLKNLDATTLPEVKVQLNVSPTEWRPYSGVMLPPASPKPGAGADEQAKRDAITQADEATNAAIQKANMANAEADAKALLHKAAEDTHQQARKAAETAQKTAAEKTKHSKKVAADPKATPAAKEAAAREETDAVAAATAAKKAEADLKAAAEKAAADAVAAAQAAANAVQELFAKEDADSKAHDSLPLLHEPVTLLPTKALSLDATSALLVEFESLKKYNKDPEKASYVMQVEVPETKPALVNLQRTTPTADKPTPAKSGASLKASTMTITKKADGTGTYSFSLVIKSAGYKNYTLSLNGAGLATQTLSPVQLATGPNAATPVVQQTGDGEYSITSNNPAPAETTPLALQCQIPLSLQNFDASNKLFITVSAGEKINPKDNSVPPEDPAKLEVNVVEAPASGK